MTPVVQGNVVIVSGLDHPVRALRVRYTVAEAPTWAHLAVVGDGILLKDAGSLAYLGI